MTSVIILNPKAFRFPVLISVQAAWLPYCSTSWEPSGLEILGPCSQDRPYGGLWALEALAPTEFPPLWLSSAIHSTKTDQNYVRLHQSAQCSLQHSSFRIYRVSCGFGFCQKWGVILPSSFLQPQRKHENLWQNGNSVSRPALPALLEATYLAISWQYPEIFVMQTLVFQGLFSTALLY